MSPELLKEVIAELNGRLCGGVVSKVHQPDGRDIVLKVFARGGQTHLLISTHPLFSRLLLTEEPFANPAVPKRFCAFLRSRINDSRIERISQVDAERIALITLQKGRGTDIETFTLRAELTGKSSNIILLDADGAVLDALRYFDEEGSARPVMPGVVLGPLPPGPDAAQKEAQAVTKSDAGTWNEAADRYYSGLIAAERSVLRRGKLLRACRGAEARCRRKLDNLNGDKARAIREQDYAAIGNMLLANFKILKRGMKEVDAVDYTTDPPATVKITLDERLGPKENCEKYFKRARKGKTALAMLEERIPATERELEYIQNLSYEIEAAETADDLDAAEEELMEAGYMKRDERASETEPIRRSTSSEGFELLCGKSGPGNDLIVKRYGKDGDIWFHAKGCPGSHVLIKVAGRAKELTMKTIEEAAALAAKHSKAANAARVEVIYTDACHVRKPKGAPPGTVTVSEYKTVVIKN
ncbi:MAG: NFACT family protein [Deltaproteobacteria bacterium]|nr:NFACT family protein [Deltaproteobacteria bacterium]